MLKKITKVIFRSISETAYCAWMFLLGFLSLHFAASCGTIVLGLFLALGCGLWMYDDDIVDRCKASIVRYEEQRAAEHQTPEAKASPKQSTPYVHQARSGAPVDHSVIDIKDIPSVT